MTFRLFCLSLIAVSATVFAQRITESTDNWTFGPNQPTIQSGTRGDGSSGSYHYQPVGTSAYCYEVASEGEGDVMFWIYDPGKCMANPDPGYGSNGPRWGLQNPLYQAMTVGISRPAYVSGCLGYSPWATVSPYSHYWFANGVRGSNGASFTPGWYKWRTEGLFDQITFTLYQTYYELVDDGQHDDIVFGNCSRAYDATSMSGTWAAMFGSGWKAFWLKGDVASTGIEDTYADVVGGTGVFAEFGDTGTTGSNHPPTVTSRAETLAWEDSLYQYDVNATDPDSGDVVASYALTTAPTGMTINSSTGLIQWTPINSQVGRPQVVVRANDNHGAGGSQTFYVTVINRNDLPTISTTAITQAWEDSLYRYDVNASDIDVGDVLTYALLRNPAGMSINAGTGLISWAPNAANVGVDTVEVRVTDGHGGEVRQKYALTTSARNDRPVITSVPVTHAVEDSPYSYQMTATDEEGDGLLYLLIKKPTGMTITSSGGLITWVPGDARVSDGIGYSDQQFVITVNNINDLPVIVSIPITTAMEDSLYRYVVVATDADRGDVVRYRLLVKPDNMQIDSVNGVITWTLRVQDVGTETVLVVAYDRNGGQASQLFGITITHINHAPGKPMLLSPVNGSQIKEDGALVWSPAVDVDPGDVVRYRLELSTQPSFGTMVTIEESLVATVQPLSILREGNKLQKYGVYYWRVQAWDNSGGISVRDSARYFVYTGNPIVAVREHGLQWTGNNISIDQVAYNGIMRIYSAEPAIAGISFLDVRGNSIVSLSSRQLHVGSNCLQLPHNVRPGIYFIKMQQERTEILEKILVTE
jgi:hypothetical protein